MRSLFAFGFVALVIVAVVLAGEESPTKGPRIVGETHYGPYELVRLKAFNYDPKVTLRWRVTPDTDVQRADTAVDLLQFVAPPGTYTVDLLVVRVVGDKAEIEEARVKVWIGHFKDADKDGNKDTDKGKDKDKDKGKDKVVFVK
jgi:hypothetical protein